MFEKSDDLPISESDRLDDTEFIMKLNEIREKYARQKISKKESDFTIHSSAEKLNRILAVDDTCDYFYKIRIPKDFCKILLNQLDALGFHESTIYPDMEHIAREQKSAHFNF